MLGEICTKKTENMLMFSVKLLLLSDKNLSKA